MQEWRILTLIHTIFALNKYILLTLYHLVEWNEDKILKFIGDGWSLSWDKTNKRYKLQKRIEGKVKSYTLPRELNSYCGELREILNYLKLIKKYGLEEAKEKLHDIKDVFGDEDYDKLDRALELYCKIYGLSYEYQLLKALGGVRLLYTIEEIYYLWQEINMIYERIHNMSKVLKSYLGSKEITIVCPKCNSPTTLKQNERWEWVCSKCGKEPF